MYHNSCTKSYAPKRKLTVWWSERDEVVQRDEIVNSSGLKSRKPHESVAWPLEERNQAEQTRGWRYGNSQHSLFQTLQLTVVVPQTIIQLKQVIMIVPCNILTCSSQNARPLGNSEFPVDARLAWGS